MQGFPTGKAGAQPAAPLHEGRNQATGTKLAGLGWGGLGCVQVGEDFLGRFAGDDFGEFVDAGALEVGNAAELAEKLAGGGWADAGNLAEGSVGLALAPTEAMESDGEAMSFVANLLDQVENRRMAVQFDGFVFLAIHVEDFFLLGDAAEWLVDDGEGF